MATENSPLLGPQLRESTSNGSQREVPIISEAIHKARSMDLHLLGVEDFCNDTLFEAPESIRYSFTLVVLLSLRKSYLDQIIQSEHDWEHWANRHAAEIQVDALERRIMALWRTFLNEFQDFVQLEEVLWTHFSYDRHTYQDLRVIDLLAEKDAPKDLLCDSAALLSTESYWRYGHYPVSTLNTFGQRLARHWDTMTPRISHFLDLVSQLATLALLAHYLILPTPTTTLSSRLTGQSIHKPGPREIILMILCFGNTLRITFRSLPFLLVLLSFLVSLPSTPQESSIPFYSCLCGFVLLFVQLHYPSGPSPIFLVPPRVLPLAVFLSRGLTHVMFPVLGFFVPALLISGLLLSISMEEWVPGNLNPVKMETVDSPVFAPMITRDMLLALGIFVLLCFVCSLVLVGSSTSTRQNSSEHWDRYSESVGLEARLRFIRTTVHYADDRMFPPPFNIFKIIFTLLRHVFGAKTIFNWIELGLWRLCVGPLNALINVIVWIFSRHGLRQRIRRS